MSCFQGFNLISLTCSRFAEFEVRGLLNIGDLHIYGEDWKGKWERFFDVRHDIF